MCVIKAVLCLTTSAVRECTKGFLLTKYEIRGVRKTFIFRNLAYREISNAVVSEEGWTVCLLFSVVKTDIMEPSPSREAKLPQQVKNFPAFYGTRMFITAIASQPVPILSKINPVHSCLSNYLTKSSPFTTSTSKLSLSFRFLMYVTLLQFMLHAPPVSFFLF